jgi:dolichol-phosphate mannosyltransferase
MSEPQPTAPSVLVILPTYNEATNLPRAVAAVRRFVETADVLIVDDASPDGTGELADELAAGDGHVHVLHRKGKAGLGAAYLAAFRWGLGRGYDAFVEMDADGSHQAVYLPELLDALQHADVAIGSRWVAGGRVQNWSKVREALSRGGNGYVRFWLGLDVHDATAGYRAYRRSTLERIDLDSVESQGYCFQIDLTRRCRQEGLRIAEVPITFVERTLGESKMSSGIVAEAMWRVTQWGTQDRVRRLTRRRTEREG